jgi:hypothetical protein
MRLRPNLRSHARAVVTLARIQPDPESTVRTLSRLLPEIEGCAILRSRKVQRRLGTRAGHEDMERFRTFPEEEQDARIEAMKQQVERRKQELLAYIRDLTQGPP